VVKDNRKIEEGYKRIIRRRVRGRKRRRVV
jgi:hypothetical protein